MITGIVDSLFAWGLAQADAPIKAFEGGAGSKGFQSYVFWAYGAVCILLGLFTLWSTRQAARLQARVGDLSRRLAEAPPKGG